MNILLKIQKAYCVQESHRGMGPGFQFGMEQVSCPALITSFSQEVRECAFLPLPFVYFILFYFAYLFYSDSDKVLSDLIHPHCWTLLQVTSGPQDFWEHFSYSWGSSKIILCQVENEAVISPGSAQHKGRRDPSSCFISF